MKARSTGFIRVQSVFHPLGRNATSARRSGIPTNRVRTPWARNKNPMRTCRMNPNCLRYRLTPEEREFFNSAGYLIVDNAVEGAMIDRLLAAIGRIDGRERTAENRGKLLSVTNIIREDPSLVELTTWPTTLPK